MTQEIEPLVFTLKQTARLIGISELGVRRLVRTGRLKAVRIGPRGWRVPKAEVLRICQEGTEKKAAS